MNINFSIKTKKKKGPQIGLNIGASSILVVFILLCLVTFAVLSLVSANADYKLSTRVADHTTAYYEATSKANEELAEKAKIHRNGPELIDYRVPVSETQDIHVIAKLPATDTTDTYDVMCWMVENTNLWDDNENLLLFDPNQFMEE